MNPATRARLTKRPHLTRAQRRETLLHALELILETTPLLEVRIKDIAHGAGCAASTFYEHFDDLTEAAAALVNDKLAESDAHAITDRHLAAIAHLFTVEHSLPAAA